ncbi:MAG: ABC transporter substrate-binding protein [Armatimonadota bacterium]
MGKRIWHVILTIALLSVVSAAGAAPAPGGQQASGPTVWSPRPLVTGSCCDDPKTIDPAVAIDIPGTRIVNLAYEALLRYKPGTPELEAELATGWQVSTDSRLYTFQLRPGVKFHDGTEFNARAVKVSFDRVKAMKLGVSFFLEAMTEVKVVGPMTVQIVLSRPDVVFLYGVPRIKIVSPSALAKHRRGDDWAQGFFRENEAGTGAYRLDRWDRGRQIEMVAFENYWKGWKGKHIQRVVERFSLDLSTKLLLLEQGELDLIDPIGLSDIKRLRNNPKIRIGAVDVLRGYYHTLNNRRGPLRDVRVRRAMLLAFPYDEMVKDLMAGYATPMRSLVPSTLDGYCAVFEPRQDLRRARELLTEAGYPSGGFRLTLIYLPGIEPERLSAQLFKAALAELGVTLELEVKEWGTLLEAQKRVDTAPDFSALYVTSPVPYAGAQLFRLGHSSIQGSSFNWQFYEKKEFDRLVEDAQQTVDRARRNQMLCQAQRMMMDDAAIIPIMNQQWLDASRTRRVGYKYDAFSYTINLLAYDLYMEGD